MKTALAALALLLASALYTQPAHAQVQIQPGPRFSVQIGPEPPRPPEQREWREREGYYGTGWEERREERWREEHRARERCERIVNLWERERCFYNFSNQGR
jgi:hypothetical protein